MSDRPKASQERDPAQAGRLWEPQGHRPTSWAACWKLCQLRDAVLHTWVGTFAITGREGACFRSPPAHAPRLSPIFLSVPFPPF